MNKKLTYHSLGRGHYKLVLESDAGIQEAVTTNTIAIDAAFDDDYDTDTNGRYYDSQAEALQELINEVLNKNQQ